ncbi:MAG: hypothetical protein J6X55_10850 [Victivallales bacterium]|nr:hypothetical protein [Victivallales bacterium]
MFLSFLVDSDISSFVSRHDWCVSRTEACLGLRLSLRDCAPHTMVPTAADAALATFTSASVGYAPPLSRLRSTHGWPVLRR